MDVSDLKGLFAEVKKRMDGHIDHVRRELGGVRTGRASVNILDTVHVEAYGSMVPLNQVASLSVPEPAMIIAQPFDPSLMNNVEKGIRAANIGLNPTNDGKVIRIPIPAADRRAPQGAVEDRPQVRRGRAQRRPPGPPRGERQAEEDAEGLQDLAGRRAQAASTRSRRSPTSTSR